MPRIPVYTASGSLQGAPVSPEASPLAFNKAAGLGNLAQGIGAAADDLYRVGVKKAHDAATTWTNSVTHADTDAAQRFLADPKNEVNPNVAEDLSVFLNARAKENLKNAPNSYAEKMYQAEALSLRSRTLPSALAQGGAAMNRIAVQSSRESISSIVNNTLAAHTRDPANAIVELEASWQRHNAWIESTYGTTAPKVAAILRGEAAENVALGVASINPEFAKKIVRDSKDLDESFKQTTLNKIDSLTVNRNRMAQLSFQAQLDNTLANGRDFLEPIKLPPHEAFTSVYGENADVMEAKYALNYKAVNDAAEVYSKNKDKRADYQMQEANKMAKDNPLTGNASRDYVLNRIAAAAQVQKNDLGGWIKENNAEVKAMFDASSASVDPADAQDFRDRAMDLMLKYQGNPPVGTSEEEAAKYFRLGTAERHVFSNDEATHWAESLNAAPPQSKSAMLEKFYQDFGLHADYAWRDLERVPGNSVSMELQMAKLINSQTMRANVLGAIADPKAIAALTEQRTAEFKRYVFKNANLEAFKRAKLGDHFQGSREAAAVDSMVTTYAQSLTMSEGLSVQESVVQSVQRILGDNIFARSINGQSVLIPTLDENNKTRLPEDADDIRTALTRRIANFPVGQVDWSRLVIPAGLNDAARRALISSQGFYRTEQDGQAVTLYLDNRAGPPTQLLDKSGNPFKFRFSDQRLPAEDTSKSILFEYNFQP